MQALLILLSLVSAPPEIRSGTAIFIEDGFLSRPIGRKTDSPLCHAAIILPANGELWVYESTFPCVKRTLLYDYQKKMAKKVEQRRRKRMGMKIHYVSPKKDYTLEQLEKMRIYADGQLGRKYKMRGYWKDKELSGIHCSQYVGDIISQTGRIQSEHWKETPVSLYEKCKEL